MFRLQVKLGSVKSHDAAFAEYVDGVSVEMFSSLPTSVLSSWISRHVSSFNRIEVQRFQASCKQNISKNWFRMEATILSTHKEKFHSSDEVIEKFFTHSQFWEYSPSAVLCDGRTVIMRGMDGTNETTVTRMQQELDQLMCEMHDNARDMDLCREAFNALKDTDGVKMGDMQRLSQRYGMGAKGRWICKAMRGRFSRDHKKNAVMFCEAVLKDFLIGRLEAIRGVYMVTAHMHGRVAVANEHSKFLWRSDFFAPVENDDEVHAVLQALMHMQVQKSALVYRPSVYSVCRAQFVAGSCLYEYTREWDEGDTEIVNTPRGGAGSTRAGGSRGRVNPRRALM